VISFVEALGLAVKAPAKGKARVGKLLADSSPNRAVVREVILETDGALNPWVGTVAAALKVIPELLTWAKSPMGGLGA
jgi:hypothetical protein